MRMGSLFKNLEESPQIYNYFTDDGNINYFTELFIIQ